MLMVQFQSKQWLLTEEDLPETDNLPVDNELQIIIPALLRSLLTLLWADRTDWYMGINLGVYYDPDQPAIGPDAFLSLGVERFRPDGKLRLSYVIPRENDVVPQWVLEIVSKTPGGEYGDKMQTYAQMGVLYYTIYNPDHAKRDQHERFEVYCLDGGSYRRVMGNPVWMPEVGLGIGAEVGYQEGQRREWLYWYNQQGQRYQVPEELLAQAKQELAAERQQLRIAQLQAEEERQQREAAEQRAKQERQLRELAEQRAEELARRLRELGEEV
jgi:Uma2 family endonuclease